MNSLNDYDAAGLDRAVNNPRGGFYILTGSPRAQAAAVAGYDGLAVFDYAKDEERKLLEISRLMDAEPAARAYVFLNFQLALWDRDAMTWNHDAIRRLNYSRDALSRRGRTLIFCMTAEADTVLNRNAYDFYDYVKLFFHFEDPPEEREAIAAARPVDRSTGVDVKVDWSLPEEELLALAVSIGDEAEELREKARYADALYLYGKQREIREHVLGTEHEDTARTYNDIGRVYDNMGELRTALEWHQKALKINEKVLGKEHPDTVKTYNDIGHVYDIIGEHKKALEWFRKMLENSERMPGKNNVNIAITYNNIGHVYWQMRDYQEALVCYQKAFKILEKTPDGNYQIMASLYGNIGLIYGDLGEHQTALIWYQKSLAICEQAIGKENPIAATTYNNIGLAYYNMGDYRSALEWFEKSLKVKEKILGIQHPETIITYDNLADTYAAMFHFLKARQYRRKAAEARRQREKRGET